MRIEKLLEQLKREFIKVNLIQASLDSLLFFLASNLVLFSLSIRVFEAVSNIQMLVGATFIFLVADLGYRTYNYRLEIYEEKNPQLQEVLRTARDNIDQQNVVSQALFDEVVDRARSVSSESIIPSKEIIQKILAVGILSFLTVLSGMADFRIDGQGGDAVLDTLQQFTQDQEDNFTLYNSSEIFGEPRKISGGEIDFKIEGGSNQSQEGATPYASEEDVVMESAPSGLEEDLQLAKQYSLAIKNFSQ